MDIPVHIDPPIRFFKNRILLVYNFFKNVILADTDPI